MSMVPYLTIPIYQAELPITMHDLSYANILSNTWRPWMLSAQAARREHQPQHSVTHTAKINCESADPSKHLAEVVNTIFDCKYGILL